MNGIDYLFILTTYVVATSIKGLTGIGFSTSCLPIMTLRLDLKAAISLVIIPVIASNIAGKSKVGQFKKAHPKIE